VVTRFGLGEGNKKKKGDHLAKKNQVIVISRRGFHEGGSGEGRSVLFLEKGKSHEGDRFCRPCGRANVGPAAKMEEAIRRKLFLRNGRCLEGFPAGGTERPEEMMPVFGRVRLGARPGDRRQGVVP